MYKVSWRNSDDDGYIDGYIGTVSYGDEYEIKDMLIGRKVVDANEYTNTITLDNGTRMIVVPNDGCSGCGAGSYCVRHLSKVNNAITNVEFVKEDVEDGDTWYNETHYRIYVVADGLQTELLDVFGSDGNGWYGTGYELDVYIDSK